MQNDLYHWHRRLLDLPYWYHTASASLSGGRTKGQAPPHLSQTHSQEFWTKAPMQGYTYIHTPESIMDTSGSSWCTTFDLKKWWNGVFWSSLGESTQSWPCKPITPDFHRLFPAHLDLQIAIDDLQFLQILSRKAGRDWWFISLPLSINSSSCCGFPRPKSWDPFHNVLGRWKFWVVLLYQSMQTCFFCLPYTWIFWICKGTNFTHLEDLEVSSVSIKCHRAVKRIVDHSLL